ncbi:hypothetical protein K438DRAFT_1772375 [Mycena galopus ATCC 62051]|nr:hypothetical protein K438DRAFT_1772375 [Mycena galopus ATCC 62051]
MTQTVVWTPTLNETQALWNTDIEPTMLQILTESEPLTFAAHAATYSVVSKFVSNGKRDGRGGVGDSCPDLYAQVELFFTQYTSKIAALQAAPQDDGALPEYYDFEWDRFGRGARVVDRLLDCLNRYYVGRVKGRKTVRKLTFDSWKTNVFEALRPRLENTDDQTRKERLETIENLFKADELTAENINDMRLRTKAE